MPLCEGREQGAGSRAWRAWPRPAADGPPAGSMRWPALGCAGRGPWRMMPHNLPPGHVVGRQAWRWYKAGASEAIAHAPRVLLRLAQEESPAHAGDFDGRMSPPTPGNGAQRATAVPNLATLAAGDRPVAPIGAVHRHNAPREDTVRDPLTAPRVPPGTWARIRPYRIPVKPNENVTEARRTTK